MTTPQEPKNQGQLPEGLQELRDRIDDVDHRLLRLLEERNELIGQVAAIKRRSGYGIRDYARERQLLADRGKRGGEAGVRQEVVESLFRVILWASRDRQAALGAELPLEMETRTVAIIGGNGGMGSLMARLFREFGHEVLIADVDTTLTSADAAAAADVTLISVPIEETIAVIEQVGPRCKEDGLLVDVTSIKCAPMAAMLGATTASVIGMHPLFGPSVHSLQGQRLVLVPGRDSGSWMEWMSTLMRGRGLVLLETTAEEHDAAMGIVQVLTHHATEVLGRSLQLLDVDIQKTLQFTSPIYLMELLMAARHFAQSADLYASIQMHNPETSKVLDALVCAGEELRGIVERGDREEFAALFASVHDHFGDFSEQALEQSAFLIDRLVERE